MALLALGLNHKTAPIAIRERIFFDLDHMSLDLRDLISQDSVNEAAILSTCNRTEVYCDSIRVDEILAWLCQRHNVCIEYLNDYIYLHNDLGAVKHIMRVASGLDSMLLGEPQIFGQMKRAFSIAKEVGSLGPNLETLSQNVFAVTKQIRSTTGIGASPVSLTYAAITLARQIFSSLATKKALLIGAGETIELALRYLKNHNVEKIYIANRTYAKAKLLAKQYQVNALMLGDLLQILPQADIIITATSAHLPILGKGAVERALKIRKRQPIFMVDLAVPRDIEPEVANLNDVYLYSMDDLKIVVETNLNNRKNAVKEAEKIIEIEAMHFIQKIGALSSVNTIRKYRTKVEKIKDEQVQTALKALKLGMPAEEVIMTLGRNLANKIMHHPTVQLNHAGLTNQVDLLEYAEQLLDLKE